VLSVIIPNYNHSAYLQQRINSVLEQSYQDFEVIILDDCSTDNSTSIIEQYRSHPKVSHIVYNQTNSGSTFKQWNKGIAMAAGKYIWIAESDDYADPQFAGKCIVNLMGTPGANLVYTDSVEIDENDAVLGRWSRWMAFLDNNLWTEDFTASGNDINAVYHHQINVIPNASGVIFKKEAYLASPFIKHAEALKFTGDWLIWFSLMQNAQVCYCHQPLNYFRYHVNTTRSLESARLENVAEQYKTILKLRKLVKPLPDKNITEKKHVELYALWNPALKQLLKKDNINILQLAFITDPKVLTRILNTALKKLHVI
jgi:glycosyltransferase involved in cell wall biosynthesis